jgi:hypothetical protein
MEVLLPSSYAKILRSRESGRYKMPDRRQELSATTYVVRVISCVLGAWLGLASGINPAWPRSVQARTGQDRKDDSAQAQVPQSKDITFKLEIMSDGKTENGLWTHTDQYVASDGKKVYVFFMKCDSPASTLAATQEGTKSATRILERTQRVNKDGSRVGERILADFPAKVFSLKDAGETVPSLIWTNGLVYRQISSGSLENVLAMEKFLKLQ